VVLEMVELYMFDSKIVRYSKDRVVLYPPAKYQEKLKKHHGKKVKVLVLIEE
jgi:hypothetical protein